MLRHAARRVRSNARIDRAIASVLEPLERRTLLSITVTGIPNWTEQGPGPMQDGQGRGIPNQPVTGAIHAVATHPTDANTMWVGTIGGGVWKTEDGGTTWKPKTDQFPSLSISALALDPNNPNVLWAGTGRKSSSYLGGKTTGLLKSIDGGETWIMIKDVWANQDLTVHTILSTKIVQGSGHVVLIGSDSKGHGGGLLRSSDGGGGSFDQISGIGSDTLDNDGDGLIDANDPTENNGLPEGTVDSLVVDPGNINRIYLGMRGHGVFVSDNGGVTWAEATALSAAIDAVGTNNARLKDTIRIDLTVSQAAAPNGNRPVYAASVTAVKDTLFESFPPSGSTRNEIVVSPRTQIEPEDELEITNAAGETERAVVVSRTFANNVWTIKLNKNLTKAYAVGAQVVARNKNRITGIFRSDDHGQSWTHVGRPGDIDGGIHPGGQAELHFSMLADKNNPDVIYVGGDRQPRPFPNNAGAISSYGRLLMGTFDATNAADATFDWATITDNGANGTAPHADSRAMAYDANGQIIELDDGGIHKLANPSTPFRQWQSLNGNLRLTEFYSVAMTSDGRIFGGAQDNGVTGQDSSNSLAWDTLRIGDGGIVGNIGNTRIFSTQNLGGFRIGDNTPDLKVFGSGSGIGAGLKLNDFDKTIQFIQPWVVNSVDSDRMLFGTQYLYETQDYPGPIDLADILIPLGGTPRTQGDTKVPNSTGLVGRVNANAMVYGGMQGTEEKPDIGWIGTDGDTHGNFLWIRQGGKFGKFEPVKGWTEGEKAPKQRVVAIATDPSDWRHVFVLDGNGRVWYSDDGDKAPDKPEQWQWAQLTKATNSLHKFSATKQFNDIAIYRAGNKRVLLVGGAGGLYRLIEPSGGFKEGAGFWSEFGGGPVVSGVPDPFGGGLPNTVVTDIEFVTGDKILVGTMGRGVYTANAGDLLQQAVVEINGGSGDQTITLRRDAARPWLLNIFEYATGGLEPNTPTMRLPLPSIEAIIIDGGEGNDNINIDGSNGLIAVSDGIAVDGGENAGDDDELIVLGPDDVTTVERGSIGPIKAHKMVDRDVFGREGTQLVLWNDLSIEFPPIELEITEVKVGAIGKGIDSLSDAFQDGTVDSLAGKRIAGLDAQSIGAGIGGQRITAPRAKDDQFLDTSTVSPDSASQLDSVTSVLRRLIEEADQGFPIASIGIDPSLDTLAELRDRLDALDGVANNVQLITNQDVDGDNVNDTQFALQIVNQRLGGIVNLDVFANTPLGEVNLFGGVEFDAEVDLNVTFGFDRTGFFVRPSAAGTPAVQLTDFKLTGDVGGTGRFGFLGVDLTDGTLSVDPNAGIELSLLDPGTGADADNKVRPSEFTPNDFSSLIGVTIRGDPGDGAGNEDMILDGTFGVAAVLGSNATPLFSADAQLKWADLTKPTEVTIDTTSSLASLFDFDANAFVTSLLGVAEHIKSVTGVDVFATKIPLLDRSLDDILGGETTETFDDAQILDVTAVFEQDGFRKFRVTLNEINPLERGIATGNVVSFVGTDSTEHAGTIDDVDSSGFVVSFDINDSVDPQIGADELVKVTRQGSATDMITSWLGKLTDPIGLTARMPTFQDLAAALGVDASLIRIENGAIELPIVFELDPLNYSEKLDFGTSIGGLKLTAGGKIDVEISPTFKFTAGLRITSGVPLDERLFIKEDTEPEVTIGLKVTVDDPTASGHIGFLDVALEEDGDNDGINLVGSLKLNLTDPGSDGRIVLGELTPSNLLSSFDASISADFVINPLKITATVGDATELGKMTINLDAADGHVASLADLQDLPSKIQITGQSNFSNFQNITPEMILAALRALIERLRDMGAGGVLDRKLPVIDKSISDLFNVADKLAEDLGVLEGNDFSSASKLQAFLQDQLGNAVTVTVGSDSIQFRLNFAKNVVESLPFSLNLGDTWGLFKVDANGNILFTADATADVSFGLLTGSNLDLADRVYFDTAGDDASKVTITGSANLGYDGGNGFDAHVKLGFFDFDVVGARAFLDAELVGALIDPDDAGRLTFREITDKVVAGDVTDVFDGNFTGRVQARVPLDGDGNGVDASGSGGTPGSSSGDALIEVAGLLENLGNVAFDDPNLHADDVDPLTANQLDPTRLLVYTHNLDNLIANAVLNFDNLIEGLEKLIEWGDKLLGIGVLDFELPFTGASLRDAINFFKDPSGPFATIIAAINGSGGLGDNPSDSSAMLAAQDINDALAALSGLSPVLPGGDILKFQHLNNDVTQPLVGATFKFRLSVPFNLPLANPKFDLGLDFFDMNADVALGVSGFVDLLVGLGIDKAHGGFYLITEFPELAVDEPELSLRQLRITANGNASVDVGFLEMGATFDPLKNFLQTNLRINLNGLDDDRLTLSELADLSNLTAIVDRIPGAPGLEGLDLNVSARVDVPLTVANNPDLPSMSTNFVMQWGPFTLDDIRVGTPAFTTPLVELRDVRLNPGEFIDRYAMPFLQTLDRYNVLAPVIDKLDDPLPIIGGTLFDLLVTNNLALTQQQRDTATFLFNIAKTVSDFDAKIDDASGLTLNFGNVAVRPDRTLDTSNADPTGQADDTTPAPQQFPGDHLPFVGDLIRDLGEVGVTFPMLNVGSLVQLFMGNTTDLIFADLPELHVGKEFFEKIPIYSVGIPYIASATINAVFGGSIDLYVNLAAGLDSSGISRGLSHVLEGLYIGDFAPGDDHQITPGDEERPEVWLEASVSAGINARASLLGFDVLSVTGKASIGGAVGLDLNDDNDLIRDPFDLRDDAARADGKFYLGEIEAVIDSTGGEVFCMFDVVGEVFAKLAFEISVPYAPNPDWSHRWTLVKFDIECEPSPPLTPDFADVIGTSLVFTSSIGASHGDLHSRAATNHADGDAIEVFLLDKNGNADDGDETLRIRKNGFTEDFGPLEGGNNHLDDISELTLITDEGDGSLKFKMTDFGAGPDNVLIDQAIRIPVRLAGGGDNDTLTAADGGGTLFGGDGDDYLSLAAPPTGLSDSQRLSRSAFFDGGAGSDQIFGGVGNDTVLGGEGNDTVDGGGSGDGADSGNDTLVGGGGDDVLDGRGGVDRVIGDYDQSRYPRPTSGAEEGADFLAGGGAGDILWGDNRGTSDSADGPAPEPSRASLTGDFIYGGDGSDLVFGGAGNDQIQVGPAGPIASIPNRAFGGTGNDAITGGTGRDSLVGNAGDDLVDGAGDNDLLYAGDDTFGPNLSNQGFDRLIGGAGFDLLDGSDANSVTASGDAGTDSVIGSRGADDLQGGDERDFILAGPGNDLATGGAGDDDILGGDGTVGNLTVDFSESDGADSIAGDAGNDVLLGDNGTVNNSTRATATTEAGGAGADTVTGAAGNDSILGGGAGDRLDGGTEADLIFGDFGTIDPALASNVNFTSANTQATSGGDDVITGGTANDTAIGGQGADQIAGGDGDDDLIGGHNVAGGRDGADAIDGDAGNDAIAGDNAAIVRRSDSQSRNSRALVGATLYTPAGAPNVTGAFQVNLDGGVGREITLYDHTAATAATLFGADNLAGGVGHDSVFGQLGNDRIQGDGATALNVSATQPSANTANDGNDYAEGGGGDDVMFGNSGQDDLIGGSSNLFGLGDGSRPDGADVIFGGAGDAMSRNALGDTTPGGHARDADVILGDNGNVFRIVSADGASTYKTFNYDNYSGGVRIVPRAVALLDYSADGNGANDLGAGDHLHGEAGDDSIHGMSGNDFLTGDGQDDHLLGESGDDWLSGGAGDDGMLGDDGKIITSRNGMTEPLYGITAATSQQVIEVKSLQLVATINVAGLLKHEVDLEPFTIGGADVMYGGVGNDAMHGGAGQDLMSGAEALPAFYLPAVIPTLTFNNGKFDVFGFTTPMAKITDHPLNFDAGTAANVIRDGNDVLFGDAGNDWLVGGTDTDRLYGGYGDDVHNIDDDLETAGGANTSPDAAPYAGADYAFGGAGRDVQIGNAPEDRLIDWVGEFNGYYVPFSQFGQSTVVRQISSQLVGFLYQLSRSDGADRTRVGPGLGTAARNGEPFGELGLVIQQDPDWLAQNGPPIGPQPQ